MSTEHSLGEAAIHLLLHGVSVETRSGAPMTRMDLEPLTQIRAAGEPTLEIALQPQWRLPISARTSAETRTVLRLEGEGAALLLDQEEWPVRVKPRPAFLAGQTPDGHPRTALCRSFFGSLLFHPLHVEAEGAERRLVISPPGQSRVVPLSYDDVLDTVEAALAAGEIDCVSLRWLQRLTPGELDLLICPLLQSIRRTFDVVIALDCPPPTAAVGIDMLYGHGADAINIPTLSLSAEALSDESRPAPLSDTLEALERAAVVFPRGTALSSLLVGLDSPTDTLRAITRLAQIHVRATWDLRLLQESWQSMRRVWTQADLVNLWRVLEEEIVHAKLQRPWTPHPLAEAVEIPTAAFDADQAGEVIRTGSPRSRTAQALIRNLIRLRRRLRVRRAEQSFESSEL
ncbi:hypothetical protein JXA47_03185 [Candidatus Sumerlaeota bacterium]|nr:hypothetical protein [Candidatus Sumerlaeota bacterium]